MIKYRKSSLFFVALMFFCGVVLPVIARGDNDTEDGNKSNASSRVGTIIGSVRDSAGRPVASAVVSLLRDAAGEEVVRQTRSDQDGSFAVRTAPGRYILRVVAEGFTTAAFTNVEVGASAELIYRFDLIPAGRGRTAPEQVNNRNDSRFTLRSAHRRRSIFQVDQEEDADLELALERAAAEQNEAIVAAREESTLNGGNLGRPRGLVETYYVASGAGFAPYSGVNFALVAPARTNLDFVLAGQTGTSVAPQRLEATARARLSERHRLSVGVAATRLPVRRGLRINTAAEENNLIRPARASINSLANVDRLAQISARAIEEWALPNGVVVILGFDYARFLGAGDADAFMPRFGLQFDVNARTRLRAAYAPGGEETRVETIPGSENCAVSFNEPTSRAVVFDGEQHAVVERNQRLEFGIERVLDEHSSVEATVFFDTTDGRGIGLLNLPMSAFAGDTGMSSVVEQQGTARGMRVVYARRLTSAIRASAGYSFGRGQRLASTIDLIDAQDLEPDEIFQNGFFQTAAAEVDADVREGTRVRAIVRFSSRAAVFAIDPFAGRLALYDPSLSFLVTQELPTFGLPVRAEAILDARNLLDAGASVEEGDTILIVGTTRRSLRGGIAVRF